MINLSLFDPEIVVREPALTSGRTPFWQGRSFILTLAVQYRYYLQPEMGEGDAIKWRAGPAQDLTIATASLWKNLDYEIRNNGRIVRPTDHPTMSTQITSGEMGVVGHPPMDTYNQVNFVSASTSGEYLLFVDVLAAGIHFSPKHYMIVATVANLIVDDAQVWSRTYQPSDPLLEERFTDEHKIYLRKQPL